MAYSPPAGNITSLNQIMLWTNSLVDNLLFPGVLGVTFFIIFIRLLYSQSDVGTARAFTSASFISMILAILLRTTSLINNTFMVIFIILTAVGAIWMHAENTKYG